MICTNCGKEINQDVKYCNYCGSRQNSSNGEIKPVNKINQWIRYIISILGGLLFGNILAIIVSVGIDTSYGSEVTAYATKWAITLPNIEYAIAIGLISGFIGGFIARKNGIIVGILIELLPIIVVVPLGGISLLSTSNGVFWLVICTIFGAIGGYSGENLANDNQIMSIIRKIKWNWVWLWLILIYFLYFISISIRFLVNLFVMGFEIIFIPKLWLIALFGYPIISMFLYFTFSIPMTAITSLFSLLGEDPQERKISRLKLVGLIIAIIVGLPVVMYIVYNIDVFILNFMIAKGLKII